MVAWFSGNTMVSYHSCCT